VKNFVSIIMVSGFLFNGCTTMYFHNGDAFHDSKVANDKTHVNMFFSLIEASNPLILDDQCGEDWKTIKVERTFGDGFLGSLDNSIIMIDIFDLQTVSYQCKE
jgi:hypothetical protein